MDSAPRPLPSLVAGLGLTLALLLAFAGRLFPVGLTVLLATSAQDAAGRLLPFQSDPDLARWMSGFRLFAHLRDEWVMVGEIALVLMLCCRWMRSSLAASGPLRLPFATVALMVLATSELVLIPLLEWARVRCWIALPAQGLLGSDRLLLQQSLAATAYLLLKGLAWCALVHTLWPVPRSDRRWWTPQTVLVFAAFGVTAWQLGSLIDNWGALTGIPQPRPAGLIHSATSGDLWGVAGACALITWACLAPGLAALSVLATRAHRALAMRIPIPKTHPLGVALAALLLVLLIQPLYWWVRVIGATVAYPDITDPLIEGQFAASHLSAITVTPPYVTLLLWPLLLTLGRALLETVLAWLAARVLIEGRSPLRGVVAFLIAASAMVASIPPATALAFVSDRLQLATLPAPPHLLGLPFAVMLLVGSTGRWPSRLLVPSTEEEPSPTIQSRLVAATFLALFIAGWLDQNPLLLPPPLGGEFAAWPTLALTQVLSHKAVQLPEQMAYALGWHLPVWIVAALLIRTLAPLFAGPAREAPANSDPVRMDADG